MQKKEDKSPCPGKARHKKGKRKKKTIEKQKLKYKALKYGKQISKVVPLELFH